MEKRTLDKHLDDFMNQFRAARGRCYCYLYNDDYIYHIVHEVVNSVLTKNTNTTILLVFGNDNIYARFTAELIRDFGDTPNLNDRLRYSRAKFITDNFKYTNTIVITIGVNADINVINKLSRENMFALHIVTAHQADDTYRNNLDNNFTKIDTSAAIKTFINNYGQDDTINHTYFPVEERRIGIALASEQQEEYDKACDAINNIVRAFNTIDNITIALYGDKLNNISAKEFCYNIAKANGWNEHLDINQEYQRAIDDQFNPNVLYEKARTFFNIVPLRKQIVTDADDKLPVILKICNEHKGKKVLIVNQRGEFANKVAEYLRENGIECGEYHDNIPSRSAVDANGKLLTYKSGQKKGQTKVLGAQAQSSLYEQRFQLGLDNYLSIKNKANTKLQIAFDVVIFTSAFCDDFMSWYSRFPQVIADSKKVLTYRIYAENTIEHKALDKVKASDMVTIINEDKNVAYDEESGDVILEI